MEWKMDLVNIIMLKLDKFIKDNGKMIFGMEKDSIPFPPKKFILKELGKMDSLMVMFNLFIKMDKNFTVSISSIKKMEKELFNIRTEQFFKVHLSKTNQMVMEKSWVNNLSLRVVLLMELKMVKVKLFNKLGILKSN